MAYECKLIETYPGFGPELTTDGNMEDAPATNWPGTNAAVAASTVQEHGGCQSLRVTDGGAGGGYASQSITVESGERYKIETWGYSTAAGDTWRVRIYIGGSVVWTGDTHDVTAPVAWEKDTKFYRVPDAITTIVVRLEVVGVAKVLYFDDVSVRREPPVPMTEIDLQYNVGAGYSLLDRGIVVGRPERVSLYGGRLQLELVRQDDGKRTIPLKLILEGTDGEDLIDRINALEEVFSHAARYREDDWGGEVFLQFKANDATYTNWFPVYEGEIDTDEYYKKCAGEKNDMIHPLPLWVTCEPYWEADVTYDLSNLLDNPGFEEWNGGICDSQPDCWTDIESLIAGTGTNQQETDMVEEGCEALRIEVTGIDAGDFKGVGQDLGAGAGSGRVRDEVEYTLLAWVQNTNIITNGVIMIRVNATSGVIGTALNSAAANADYTLYQCQFTPVVGDAAGIVRIEVYIEGLVNGCSGIVHIDKMLVMEASNVPTGWMSSSYLINQYDRDPNEVNWLSVCDIPGETEAETRWDVLLDESNSYIRMAKRTRENPCEFIWQLIPCEAHTELEGGVDGACQPGLTDGFCIDSDKIKDVTSPSDNHIAVTFADQTMQPRCYWDIGLDALARDLISYYGKFAIVLLASKSGATDTIGVRFTSLEQPSYVVGQTVQSVIAGGVHPWHIVDGFETVSFRIGTRNDELFGTGNYWRIILYAESSGNTDTLEIAGCYLVPLDEAYILGGGTTIWAGGDTTLIIKEMDGDRGLFAYDSATDTHYANYGAVGTYPTLTPEVENRLYFIHSDAADNVDITDTCKVSLAYRPRGIFLRGTNP